MLDLGEGESDVCDGVEGDGSGGDSVGNIEDSGVDSDEVCGNDEGGGKITSIVLLAITVSPVLLFPMSEYMYMLYVPLDS